MRVALRAEAEKAEEEQADERGDDERQYKEELAPSSEPGRARALGKEPLGQQDGNGDAADRVKEGQRERPDEIGLRHAAIVTEARGGMLRALADIRPEGIEPARDDQSLLQNAVGRAQQQQVGPAQPPPPH